MSPGNQSSSAMDLLSKPRPLPTTNLTEHCQICEDIHRHLLEPDARSDYLDVPLGILGDLLASPCQAHTSFIKSLQQQFDDPALGSVWYANLTPFDHWKASDRLELQRSGSARTRITSFMIYKDEKLRKRHDLSLVKRHEVQQHVGTVLNLNPDWVDLRLVEKWIAHCFSFHGTLCENTLKITRRPPRLLVDLNRWCIVSGNAAHRYFALSYRVGKPGLFRLESHMLASLREEHALEKPEILNQLQLTVRHALSLAKVLGAAFIWVDVLCIVHNDQQSALDEQLNDMASIYSSALLTIVAGDEDGSAGIPGLRNISEPRALHRPSFTFRNETLVESPPTEITNGGAYHRRAWTHQEFHLSPRKLIFRFGRAHWICPNCRHNEDLTFGGNVPKGTSRNSSESVLPMSIVLGGVPHLKSLFIRLFSGYNKRGVSVRRDSHSAVAGTLAVLSRTFTSGFLYGLPQMLFEVALGWNSDQPPVKRQASDRPNQTEFPSWSWLAWEGRSNVGSWEPREMAWNQQAVRSNPETSAITEWYTSDTPQGLDRRKIDSWWCRDRDAFKDVGQTLPDGWIRHEAKTIKWKNEKLRLQYGQDPPEFVYEHQDLARFFTEPTYWQYPFTVPRIDDSTQFTVPKQTRYLFCKTRKTSVWIDQHTARIKNRRYVRPIREAATGPVIGSLCIDDMDIGGRGSEANQSSGRFIEIVAISRLVDRWDIIRQEPIDHRMIKFLWVHYYQGVAYREASGEIDEDAWDNLDKEDIDLVLG